jgi:hypothetical protein
MRRPLFLQSFFLFAIGIAAIIYFQSLTVPEKFVCPAKKCCKQKCSKSNEGDSRQNILHNPLNHFIV